MNNKPIKVFFSFGIGRLHFTNLIPELVKKNLKITIVQGWTPKKISPAISFLMDKFFKRKNTYYGLEKRAGLTELSDNSYSIAMPEIIQKFLFRFLGATSYRWIISVWTWKLFGIFSAKKLDKSYDICHIRSGAGYQIIKKAKKLEIPVIIDHSIMHPIDIDKNISQEYEKYISIADNPFWKQVVQDCLNADLILVNSFLVKESLIKNGMSHKNIVVAYLGISTKFLNQKTSWKLKEDEVLNIIFTGSFGLRKGLKSIFGALEILEQREIKYQLHLFGSIDIPIEFKTQKDKFNIIEYGFIPQEELIGNLAENDIYLFPTLAEGAANSLLEAMAVGLPVITTKFSGGPITNMENGLLVNINSPEEIVESIILLKEDKKLRAKLGSNASKTIAEICTWEHCTSTINKVYEGIISSKN